MIVSIIVFSWCLGVIVGYVLGRAVGRARTVADATEHRARVLSDGRRLADSAAVAQRPRVGRIAYRRREADTSSTD